MIDSMSPAQHKIHVTWKLHTQPTNAPYNTYTTVIAYTPCLYAMGVAVQSLRSKFHVLRDDLIIGKVTCETCLDVMTDIIH